MKHIKKHKTMLLTTIIILCLILSIVLILFINTRSHKTVSKDIEKLNLDGYNKVMFVAHPDDEMLWGGGALLKDDFLVVCVTCGSRKIREEEFKDVMAYTQDKYLTLSYPDKILYKRSNWKYERKYIKKDITKILNYKKWDLIVTHNKYGEYGHQHHKMVHDIVKESLNKKQRKKLRVFNKYCSLNKLNSGKCDIVGTVSDEIVMEKNTVLYRYYTSQINTIDLFKHMLPYESLVEE